MPFMCQNDSYLKEFTTTVESVCEAKCKIPSVGGNTDTNGFEIILNDTVLFPEGGGQPDDYGLINEILVMRVTRRGAKAIHFVTKPLEVGETVNIKIDWDRRFDHMQQHTGQHLITAIADQMFGYKTTSWDLGKSVSFIELDTPNMSSEQINEIESSCNQKIRDATGVTVHVTEVGSELLKNVRARGLPADHVGSVRIIEINGVDANMCCGTHVKNLSDLMCVKLLSAEKAKKGKTNLFFLVGNRVLNYTGKKYADEKDLTKILKCGPTEHVVAVERSVKQLKQTQKVSTNLLREIAGFEARSYKNSVTENKFLRIHRREGNNEYMNIIANELKDCDFYLFLTVGEENDAGLFLIAGPDNFLDDCGAEICNLLCGKGATKGGRMQGKAQKMKSCKKVEDLIKDYMLKQCP